MSAPRMVGTRHWRSVVSVLGSGRIIAVPGDGAYQLAASPPHRNALAVLWARTTPSRSLPPGIVVGRRAQALELAPAWSKETSILTDRMWPGPLTVIVPAGEDILAWPGTKEPVLSICMPTSRPLRAVCRATGPLVVMMLRGADGHLVTDPEDVEALFSDEDVACVLDEGPCRGPAPTVVDCTESPPLVRHVGALPESFVDAALMMGNRRRKWFSKRDDLGSEPH
jgi:L-threonylcarbamoyladenylate synthase